MSAQIWIQISYFPTAEQNSWSPQVTNIFYTLFYVIKPSDTLSDFDVHVTVHHDKFL